MKTIVALVDFSDVTSKVVDHTLDLARDCEGEIFLVHVALPAPIVMDYAPAVALQGDDTEARQADLQALEASMKERYPRVDTRLFRGPVVETLEAQLPALNPDVIVMGSHGHGALYNLIVGSVTQGIIKHAVWPVMIVPAVRVKQQAAETLRGSEASAEEDRPVVIGTPGGALLPP